MARFMLPDGARMPSPTGQRKSAETPKVAGYRISPNFPKNSSRKERAAILLAEDDLSDQAIADAVGVTKRTITNWKQDPEFAALVGDYHGQIVAQALKLPIAKKWERVSVLNSLHTKALEVIEQRGERFTVHADSAEEAVRKMFGSTTPPEAATGLLVRKETITASGMTSTEWTFDSSLVKEIRELQKQAATELGQWVEKAEVDQSTTTVVQIIGDDDEDDN